VRKIPARYFLAILLLLAIGGCDSGGPPPPMVLNTDPSYEPDAPAADVVALVGDLGGPLIDFEGSSTDDPFVVPMAGDLGNTTAFDSWLGDVGIRGDVPTQIEIGWVTFPGFVLSEARLPLPGPSGSEIPSAMILDEIYEWFGVYEYNPFNDDERYNIITHQYEHWCYECDDWEPNDQPLVYLVYYGQPRYFNAPNDSATLNEPASPVPGWTENSFGNPLTGLRQSFQTMRDYFTTPNDSSSLGERSLQDQNYRTLKDSTKQESLQDVRTMPTKGIGGKQKLLEEVKNIPLTGNPMTPSAANSAIVGRRQELLEDAKGVNGIGNSPASTGSNLTTGGRRQELLDEAKITPSSGKTSGIGSGHKQELLEGSKGNSFSAKNSLEEKSFKNSVGEKSSRSTFTGDKVFSQQGTSKSFAPMGGKTFSGAGTRAPTSGKSFKMHGF
jgi:hypothetical protein